jgi:DNA-binding MarR family transcriptional regulator
MDQYDSIEWTRRRWEERDGPGPNHFAAMGAVLRLEHRIAATLDRTLRAHELNRTGYLILITLFVKRDQTLAMGQLSRILMTHPTTVSLAVDKLQARGLVERSSSTADRRTTLTTLTDSGAETLLAVSEALNESSYGFEGVSERLAISLTETVGIVREKMGDI